MNDEIRVLVLQNALEHNGKADPAPVLGKVMAFHPDMRKDPAGAKRIVTELVLEINGMTIDEQKVLLEKLGGPKEIRKRERRDPLFPLRIVEGKETRMRFAPGPSGPLHIGHTRAAILNDEYCKRYDGTFILRLEDTNPERIDPEAYTMIPEDLQWMNVSVDETYIQSDRFEIYYDIARELLEKGHAYVCTMDVEEWRDLKLKGKPSPERDQTPEEQLDRWDGMLQGAYDEGEAFMVIKTDLKHKNPAVRDFVGMRIRHAPHPRTGERYHLYPLYNLSVAIDDHLMECTHILRGKDHLNNTVRQKFVFEHMGWELPEYIHYGLVSIPDTVLKTSLIREDIMSGQYSGWDDVRLGTVRALAERGFNPDSIRRYWLEVGVKPVDIRFSWETLETMNREIIDRSANRYFFVDSPVPLTIDSPNPLEGRAPCHPEEPERGYRYYRLVPTDGSIRVYLTQKDVNSLEQGELIRLKDICNVRIKDIEGPRAEFVGIDLEDLKNAKGRILHWVPEKSLPCKVLMRDGSIVTGLVEEGAETAAERGDVVQFERFGYCKLRMEDMVVGRFTHK